METGLFSKIYSGRFSFFNTKVFLPTLVLPTLAIGYDILFNNMQWMNDVGRYVEQIGAELNNLNYEEVKSKDIPGLFIGFEIFIAYFATFTLNAAADLGLYKISLHRFRSQLSKDSHTYGINRDVVKRLNDDTLHSRIQSGEASEQELQTRLGYQ